MKPIIHFLGLHIPMYSLMMLLGVIAYVVTYFIIVEKKEKLDRTSSNRLLFVSVLGAIFLYIFAFLFNSFYHSLEEGKVVFGGITWLGGVVGGFPFVLLFIHLLVPKARGNAVYWFSMLIPGLVLGHALGRIGCFFAGCCFGKVTSGPFGVIFPVGSTAAKLYPGPDGRSLPVLPTQLFEALFELILFFVMIFGMKKYKKYNLAIYFIAYGIFRFLLEFLRGDDRGSLGSLFSPSQWSCIYLLIMAVLLILFQNGITFPKIKEKCAKWREIAEKTPIMVMGKHGYDNVAILRELQKLREDGIITEEEFRAKKEEILKRV